MVEPDGEECSHEEPCSNCKRTIGALLHGSTKHDEFDIWLPNLLKCWRCQEKYQCPYCLKLAAKLRLKETHEKDTNGKEQTLRLSIETEPFFSRVLRTRSPRQVPDELRIALGSLSGGMLASDGIWFTAFENDNPVTPGLLREQYSWSMNIRQLRTCLEECENFHGQCKMKDGGQFASPGDLYLLDLKERRLVTKSIDTSFVCLSYVWGSARSDVLDCRKSRLETLMKENALDDPHIFNPPRTVRDSMEFVEAMGERYLWVDMYCIIQDDHSHKQAQLKRMCQIYASARYTVIAADGTSTDGLAAWQSDDNFDLMHSNLWYHNKTHSILAGMGFEEVPLSQSAWNTRGWTLQERLFSSRTIVFCAGQVFWRCHREYWQQDFQCASHAGSRWDQSQPLVSPPWPSMPYLARLASAFSTRELTFPSDCVAAFSGILGYLQPHFPGGFLFAMPELWFDIALLWEPADAHLRDRFQLGEIAPVPTWSWARWKGNIACHAWDMGAHLVVLGEEMQPKLFEGSLWKDVPEESKEAFRKLARGRPTSGLGISPLVCWYSARIGETASLSIRPIHNSYNRFRHFEGNIEIKPPSPWIRVPTSDGCVYTTIDAREDSPMYKCPIYTLDDVLLPDEDDSANSPLLFGKVKRRFLRIGRSSGIRLCDVISSGHEPPLPLIPNFQLLSLDGAQIGTITVNQTTKGSIDEVLVSSKVIAERIGHVCDTQEDIVIEVIALSLGECLCHKSGDTMYHQLYQWETKKGEESSDNVYRYYNVMFIHRRPDDVAERRGIGRVERGIWDEGDSEEVDIILG